jgi:hypothetical protein
MKRFVKGKGGAAEEHESQKTSQLPPALGMFALQIMLAERTQLIVPKRSFPATREAVESALTGFSGRNFTAFLCSSK